jgi:hypothetical protein
MKATILTSPPDFAVSPGNPAENIAVPRPSPELVLRLPYDAGLRVFGRSWAIRAEIWAQLETGTPPLAEIARSYNVSRQYVGKLAKRVRECNPRS